MTIQRLRTARAFYSGTCDEFLRSDPDAIIGQLSSRHAEHHPTVDRTQINAWRAEIQMLQEALNSVGPRARSWGLLIESPLLRLGRRIDAVILANGHIIVVEFKTNKDRYTGQDIAQAVRYAHLLRDFHEVSQGRQIVPLLCSEKATKSTAKISGTGPVLDLVLSSGKNLGAALISIADLPEAPALISIEEFEASAYRPTPTIIEAAQALYAGHQITEIGRGDAADLELQGTAQLLREYVELAAQQRSHIICFVTGTPGAGKTMLGLELALRHRTSREPAALLSGNRPLVHVLTEALATDSAKRNRSTKKVARYEADAAIQTLLGYLKEHTDGALPPENVIVFDEAQRAWDEKVGKQLMDRDASEPDLFLEILGRLDWSCLICLVGPGQEINRGEGGLELWGRALTKSCHSGTQWKVVAAPQAIAGGPDISGQGLMIHSAPGLDVTGHPQLHLANNIRAYRNPPQNAWTAALLEGDKNGALQISKQMKDAPVLLTRDLAVAKDWLHPFRQSGRSVGLLASSGSVRLVAEGIPPAPRSNELDKIGHWFLKPYTDYRSSGALELPMSEFGCQGLELDYSIVCWGGDLCWGEDGWTPRQMSAPKWQKIQRPEEKRFRINGYRVLLSRARIGCAIFVPQGSAEDATRLPSEFDRVAEILQEAGARLL